MSDHVEKKFEGILKFSQVIEIFLKEKMFSKFQQQKFEKKFQT